MEKEQTRFTGILRKIQLMSRVGGLIAPEPDDEAEQRLTLCADGSVFLSRYRFGEDFRKPVL